MKKCVFLDRDGVINEDKNNYTYTVNTFNIIDGVPRALEKLKKAGYLLIIVTNQAGISKGIYTKEDVYKCHQYFQQFCKYPIDHLFYAPYHPKFTASLTRKPDSLMFEKAIAMYDIDVSKSWMIGDKETDMIPAKKMNIKAILIGNEISEYTHLKVSSLKEAAEKIILY